jgi:hypothetical protein
LNSIRSEPDSQKCTLIASRSYCNSWMSKHDRSLYEWT